MTLHYSLSDIAQWLNAKVIHPQPIQIQRVCIDSRSPLVNDDSLFIALKGHKSDGHQFCQDFLNNGGRAAIVSEPQPYPELTQLVVDDPLLALQTLAAHHRANFNIPVIGITGSHGKTTVKEWLYHVLKPHFKIVRSPKSYNSQIGVALSVLEMNSTHNLAIFEAGISRPGEMENLAEMIKPTIGIYTGTGGAHQENFTSLDQKKQEKYNLFKSAEHLLETQANSSALPTPFADQATQSNANLVWQCAKLLGVNNEDILRKLETLPVVSMRLEQLEGQHQSTLINDTYTYTLKSLEIGLQYMATNAGNKDQVLILAPNPVKKIQTELAELLSKSQLTSCILIHPEATEIQIPHKTLTCYSDINHFLNSQPIFKNSIILFSGSRTVKLEQIIPQFQLKTHITRLEINRNAIRNNLNTYRAHLAPDTKILAMVKAQSYGGGIVEMARFLAQEGANYLGVAYADEGVTLRQAGIVLPILVMNPETDAFDDMIRHELEPSVYSPLQLNQFIHQLILHGKTNYPIHVKLDTGMNRLGFQPAQITELIDTLKTQPEVYIKSVFSHFAAADDPKEASFTQQQITSFTKAAEQIENTVGYRFLRHLANSDGALHYPEAQFDMVRIGIGLFGLNSRPFFWPCISLTF